MLSGLFKPAWQSQSPEKRLQAIAKIDAQDAESHSVLETLAKDDPEFSVRQAALGKLQPGAVFQISLAHADEATRSQAQAAFASQVGSNSTLTKDEFRSLITTHPESAASIARLCPHADLRSELVLNLSEAEMAELVSEVEYAETRKQIAERLESVEQLESARKRLKGKDKNAEKIIKAKLDALRAQQKQERENQEAAEDLCTKMEYLATHDWREEFKRRYLACSSQWAGLNFSPSQDITQRYESAANTVRAEFDRQEHLDQTVKKQNQLAIDLENYCHEIAAHSLDQVLNSASELNSKVKESTAQWDDLAKEAHPNLNLSDQFFEAQNALTSITKFCEGLTEESTANAKNAESAENDEQPDEEKAATNPLDSIKALQTSITSLRWPKNYPELTAKGEADAKLAELKKQNKQEKKAAEEKLDKLHKRISRIVGSTRRGELSRARRELEAVKKAAEHYSGKERASLDDRIEKTTEALSKMGDWKDFATEPKYIELCEAMEALKGSSLHPDKLSTEINSLQKRWKALGHSDSADQHWERFKAAGDAAYEPCAEFFQKRRETRNENLQKREPFLLQAKELLETTDWDGQPDYKQVETALRNISNEWQKVKDVEQAAGQKQWKQFSDIKSAIYEKLDVVYDANIAVKNQLIEQALALVEADVKEESFNRLQQLQIRWKQVGITRRKDDQAAWTAFKKATDEVYAKIQGVRQSKRDDENAQLEGYRQIIRQIQDLAKNAKDLAEADHLFEQLQSDYQSLPPLPKDLPEKLVEGIGEDFRRAGEKYSTARDRILEAGHNKELEALTEKAKLCAQLEKCASDNASAEALDAIKIQIDAIQINEKDLLNRFDKRYSAALDEDRTEASDARRMLCIDLEILLGVESPAEDRDLRMKVQLERMQKQGIGGKQLEKDAALNELKLDWLCLPGAEPALQESLEKRFAKLVENK